MSQERYQELLEGVRRLHGADESGPRAGVPGNGAGEPEAQQLPIEGIPCKLVPFPPEEATHVLISCELEELSGIDAAMAFRRMLELNMFLLDPQGARMAVDPVTGANTIVVKRALDALTPEALNGVLQGMAHFADQWRSGPPDEEGDAPGMESGLRV